MPLLPNNVEPQTPITARLFNTIIAAIKSWRVVAGQGLLARETPSGTVIELASMPDRVRMIGRITAVNCPSPSTVYTAGDLCSNISYDAVALTAKAGSGVSDDETHRLAAVVPMNRIFGADARVIPPKVGDPCEIWYWWAKDGSGNYTEARKDYLVLVAQERRVGRQCSASELAELLGG